MLSSLELPQLEKIIASVKSILLIFIRWVCGKNMNIAKWLDALARLFTFLKFGASSSLSRVPG